MSRVLILTASFGDGHNQAAYAIAEAFESRAHIVKVLDYVEWLHPAVRSFAKFSLLQGVQKVPSLYGLFYRSMSRIQPSSSIQKQLNHLGISKLERCLQAFNADVVISTFPTPNGVMSELIAEDITDIPNIGVLTDYTAHGQWVHEHTDVYFVASESVESELISMGVPKTKIQVSGIPIRSKFSSTATERLLGRRTELRRENGFEPHLPLVLLMGGGSGLLGDVSAWEQVIERSPAQFAILCGRNEKLHRRFQSLVSPRVRVLGFTSDVNLWMAMADLIITKAGGITVTEALAMELPMLLFRPIPGQEVQNAQYAVGIGAAKLVDDVATAEDFLNDIVRSPEQLLDMRSFARRAVPRDGAKRIVMHVESLLASRKRSAPGPDASERNALRIPQV